MASAAVMATRAGLGYQVGIPWRPQPSRMQAFEETRAWYMEHGFEVIAGQHPEHLEPKPFNIAAARNQLVSYMAGHARSSNVITLSDGDTIPSIGSLMQAINAAQDGYVHLPYHLYIGANGKLVPGACSGVMVFTPQAWASTNGQDELFEGWGYEDSAWRLAHEVLNGPIIRHHGIVQASMHDTAAKHPLLTRNRQRYRMYLDAYEQNDVARMQTLTGARD